MSQPWPRDSNETASINPERFKTSAFGSGTWTVDEFNHVVIRFPTQHIDIAVTKEKTPQGMVYHYVRYGGDESVGSARVCN